MLTVTAHHEAGHAVAACVLGVPIIRVHVIAQVLQTHDSFGQTEFRKCVTSELCDEANRHKAEARIITSFAGPIAEGRFRGLIRSAQPSPSDRAAMNGLADLHISFWAKSLLIKNVVLLHSSPSVTRMRAAYLRGLKARATSLVDNHWLAVQAVADALVEKRELTARQVKALVRKSS
jgi:hypothetical protein